MRVNCIVIGAGAAGLMAAREIAKAGDRVIILEARHRIGGRIYTLASGKFSKPVEAGAGFIHGEFPLTSSMLRAAQVKCQPMTGAMYNLEQGILEKKDFFKQEWELLLEELKKLKHDMTLETFLQQRFPGEKYNELKKNIRKFVEGYNAADLTQVSALALRKDWSHDEDPFNPDPLEDIPNLLISLSIKFLFSDASIPTWLSQLQDETPLLTGWEGLQLTYFTWAE